jgi:hypothetical protein
LALSLPLAQNNFLRRHPKAADGDLFVNLIVSCCEREEQVVAEKIRIGVLGAAGIAPKALTDPARVVAEVAIVALAARDAARAAKYAAQHRIPVVYDSYVKLLADPTST